MKPQRTVADVLNAMCQAEVLACLAYVQKRQARDAVLLKLLMDRLGHTVAAPLNAKSDELLTMYRLWRMFGAGIDGVCVQKMAQPPPVLRPPIPPLMLPPLTLF